MARRDTTWQEYAGSYVAVPWAEGRDVLIRGTSKYLNFGSTVGTSGYGFRDNAGTLEFKNSGGAWAAFGSGGGSVNISGTPVANEVTYWTDPTTIGSLATATYPSLTELAYVKGVTSAIQTQLDGKLASTALSDTAYGAGWNADTTHAPTKNAVYDEMELRAPKASPTFTGTVTLPTGLTGVLRADSGVVSTDSDVTDLVTAASDITAGKVELATITETNTGTDTGRAITPDGLAGSYAGTKTIAVQVNGSASGSTALATGDGQASIPIDTTLNGMNIVAVKAYVTTVSSSGAVTINIRRSRRSSATARTIVDTLSTAITIDASEFESADATAPAINTSNDDLATGDMLLIDIDAAGTGVLGLTVVITCQLP